MNRIKNEFYTILDFPLIENETVKLSLGILGFLFVLRQSPSHICYIPSRFRQTLHTKCKQDLTQFLLDNGYLQIYQRPKNKKDPDDEFFFISKSGRRYSYGDIKRGYKKIPYLYIPTIKLTKLRQIKLRDEKMAKWIDEHLHLLNDQYFNHYEHSYKHIKLLPIKDIYKSLDANDKFIVPMFGDPDRKDYHPIAMGYDNNEWAGNHINLFSYDKHYLLKYSNLVEPIEIGLKYSECLIIADQLIRTIGDNDYSAYYLKTKYKQPLFDHPKDYDLEFIMFPQQLFTALFGYFNVSQFAVMFPKAWNILFQIKAGRDEYLSFVSNLKPTIFKTDIRLLLDKKHPAYERGQIYYKIISLVYYIRITQIMREIWGRLKKCDIIFVPLENSVVVSSICETPTTYIVEDVIKKHINTKIHFEILKNKL